MKIPHKKQPPKSTEISCKEKRTGSEKSEPLGAARRRRKFERNSYATTYDCKAQKRDWNGA